LVLNEINGDGDGDGGVVLQSGDVAKDGDATMSDDVVDGR